MNLALDFYKESLRTLIQGAPNGMPMATARPFLAQILSVLAYMHDLNVRQGRGKRVRD